MNNGRKKPDDEAQLFREAMADVAPMATDTVEPHHARHRPEPLNLPTGDEDQEEPGDLNIETGEFLDFMRPGVQHRVYRDLQRGLIEPEASLDLHGMRVVEARTAFSRFLKQSLDTGRRCVRIIHGKGRGSEGQQPVLKQKTNQWLQQTEAVLAFCTAPRWDGGTGAAYVLLSRKFARTR
jgi:DNA-nicking Smr family endonuclease